MRHFVVFYSAWIAMGMLLNLEYVFGFFVGVSYLMIMIPGYVMYQASQFLSLVMRTPRPEQGYLWEGGHGPYVLNIWGMNLLYVVLPSFLLLRLLRTVAAEASNERRKPSDSLR